MIDRKHIGLELEPHTAEIERGRLKFFAKATGQSDPVYTDEVAAKAAGYRSLPAPPTFLFSMDMEVPNPFELLEEMEIDLGRVLHGEQSFVYHKDVCAGDAVTFNSKVVDIYDKKGGALEFVIVDTTARNQNDEIVAEMRKSIVVRN